MKCPYCGKKAEWVENKEIYGKNYGKSYMAYFCRDCDAYVGCHNNSVIPKGTLANKELRELRIKCHEIIDPIWRYQGIKRKVLYKALSRWWGGEFHIGWLREDDCKYFIKNFDLKSLELQKGR